ncbi:unnamed protein product [Lactuca virosa]|uniref:Uncharacterized protein n=1 Tax=Lactuca virosa TaxID=75947 RepID=A0AAU9MJ85_9ASTR|nr:unnamed protein product [Lactuca virosa]
MGDLILRNKGPQRGREVFKQKAEKHNCIRSGPKRQLALVDEDEDDEISQADMEQFGLKDDVNKGHIVQCEARTHSYAPLTCTSWHKVPHKDKIWEYVLRKYDVPDDAKTWVLRTIGNLYKFSKLLVLWNKKDVAAKEIRKSLKNMHTAGPKRFARIRDEMKNEDPNKEFPTLSQMFERTRKRTDGRVYVDTYDDTANKIELMKKYEHLEDESDAVDPYMIVMKKENDGYRRLYGLMESFKANEVERNELIEMRKEIQEDHEKKQAELEAMRIDIKNQQQNLEAMMRKLAEQQPREGR